jgi:hypothetical protein
MGLEGREVVAMADSSVVYPVQVSPTGRYFVDQRGTPFFWLGDTAWPLFAVYSREEAETYLADRAAKGFTVIQGVLAWGGGTGFETPAPGPNYAGDCPWIEGDPARPNEAFFAHVDHLVRYAADRGLALAMLPVWGYYVQEAETLRPESARQYGRWLGARYREAPNIVWVSGGDRIPTGREQVYRELALGLREGDGGVHLITYHPCGWRSSSQFFHLESWLDFNMIETWTEWYKVHPAVMSDCLLTPTKPVVLGEGAYEDGPEYPLGPITPLVARKQAWWTFLAGGFHTYGQNQMWRMEPGWLQALDTPGAIQMGVMREIVSRIAWWKWVPDQSVFTDGPGSGPHMHAAARSVDGDWVLVYLAGKGHVTLHVDKVITSDRCRGTWFDPQTGASSEAGVFPTGNRGTGVFPERSSMTIVPPSASEDAVLLLEAH